MTSGSLLRALAALAWLACAAVQAHENLPASLILDEVADQVFDVRWRLPATQGVAPELTPRLPADCTPLSPPAEHAAPGARLSHWKVHCPRGIAEGAQIGIDGLATTMLDTLVRVGWRDGRSVSLIARPRASVVTLPAAESHGLAVSGYFALGVAHILGGIDHLLFVLCLILLVRDRVTLLKTITAFTLAHSVTLALSAIGLVRVPQAPVEACIALSILFLACELAKSNAQDGKAARRPWIVAFAFGLLHGFGFAGALAEVGLPHGDVPLALGLFNLGVEAGQLMFVVAVLALLMLLRHAPRRASLFATPWLRATPVTAVGAVSAFWWLQRMAALVGA